MAVASFLDATLTLAAYTAQCGSVFTAKRCDATYQ